MNRKTQYRLLTILFLVLASTVVFWRNGINLGLDLKGGIHLIVQVETDEALRAEAEQVRERLASALTDSEIRFDEVRLNDDLRIDVLSLNSVQVPMAEDVVERNALNWAYSRRADGLQVRMLSAERRALLELTVRQAREVIQKRIDQYGVAEPSISVYGTGEIQDQIIIELPGVEDFDRVERLIGETANLEYKLVHPTLDQTFSSPENALEALGGNVPADYEILKFEPTNSTLREPSDSELYMVAKKAAAITGRHIKNARRSEDNFTGRSEVSFFLNAEGVTLFGDVTGNNVGNLLAIVLDDVIVSAPQIEGAIRQESARITGDFTREEAEDLALVLRSGALPASIRFLENRQIGPSLGADSISNGLNASTLGLILVVLGMLVVYKLSGLNAILCLTLNLVFLAGALSYLDATLTLPGIAGVVLTIGMAVDANILIFERIKEEMRNGKTVRSAIESAFNRVFSTILDTNITTLVASVFLYQFGTGPVQGFAITLATGLLANIFTATFVSRTIFTAILQGRQPGRLSI